MNETKTVTVSQLTALIKNAIDSQPALNSVCVVGELSNYKIYPSGHHYFSLKDANSALKCVMFRNAAAKLRFRPSDGMKVCAVGRITVYPRDGCYQLYCDGLMPAGAGDLMAQFEKLKEKLFLKGYFEQSHKKPLPEFPHRICIITSPAGAAVHDMLRIIRKRYPVAEVVFLPVRVQGDEAVPELVAALDCANAMKLADVILIGRGGGSMEDLWCFNSELLADAIYRSQIPVISAVGHEPDVTISDFVADVRAATPTHGAELAVPDCESLYERISLLRSKLLRAMDSSLRISRLRLDRALASTYMAHPERMTEGRNQLLDQLTERLVRAAEETLKHNQTAHLLLNAKLEAFLNHPERVTDTKLQTLDRLTERLMRAAEETLKRNQTAHLLLNAKLEAFLNHPERVTDTKLQTLDRLTERLMRAADETLKRNQTSHLLLNAKLDALSPLKVLQRGYGIVYNASGSAVSSVRNVSLSQTLTLRLSDGSVQTTVTDILEE